MIRRIMHAQSTCSYKIQIGCNDFVETFPSESSLRFILKYLCTTCVNLTLPEYNRPLEQGNRLKVARQVRNIFTTTYMAESWYDWPFTVTCRRWRTSRLYLTEGAYTSVPTYMWHGKDNATSNVSKQANFKHYQTVVNVVSKRLTTPYKYCYAPMSRVTATEGICDKYNIK